MSIMRVNTLGFLSYRFFQSGGVDINQGTIRWSNHVMRQSFETCNRRHQGNILKILWSSYSRERWCGLVSNYETDFDEVDYENECLQFGICSMDY